MQSRGSISLTHLILHVAAATQQDAAKDFDAALTSGKTPNVLVMRSHYWRHSDPESALADVRSAIALRVRTYVLHRTKYIYI